MSIHADLIELELALGAARIGKGHGTRKMETYHL